MTEKADTINKLDEYLITYFCREHPTINSKDDFKKNYLELLKYVGSFFLKKNILEYKINIFQKNLNFEKNLEEEIFNNEKYRKKVLKKISGWNFKFFNIYTYRDLFIWDCLAIFSDGNKEKSQLILKILKNFLPKYEKRIEEICEKMYSNKYEFDLKSFINKRMYENYREIIEYSKSKIATVVFTATMSTGKSTLINAIIGKELAPSMSLACTANIANFKNSLIEKKFINYSDKNVLKLFLNSIETKNLIRNSNYCYINTYFNSVLSKKKINIIDTPGVNYSEDKSHREITRNELKSREIDVLVYVTSMLTLGTNDEYEHLKFIKENIKYQKIIIVINKIDEIKIEESTIEENISDAKEYLAKLDLKNLTICPLSAYVGSILKRSIHKEKLSRREERLVSLYINQFTNEKDFELSKFYNINLENKNDNELIRAYINTGLPIFEKILYNFI